MHSIKTALVAALLAAAPIMPALAQEGDVEAGQRVFAQCRACHTINEGGRNGVGPNLWNVYGRPAGQVPGFRYSSALQQAAQQGLVWNEENLRRYLANPRDLIPGGSMAFAGIRNPEQLTNVIAYMRAQRPQ
ncbi:MAG: cytochrome c family protein [Rhodovarius sp.]|nr:cytochrome c family protein [Rhodovarius sp.]MCX7933190.1 cytochrome c family protein [Rhodovarius sp.]MDW8313985.1 cytochrome c family protein [Rhodovarius sp.]